MHLEIIPGAVDNPAGSTANPWILAVYSNPLAATPHHTGQNGSASIIVRWQLEAASQNLHPKFDEVVSKKNHNAQVKVCLSVIRFTGSIAHYGSRKWNYVGSKTSISINM